MGKKYSFCIVVGDLYICFTVIFVVSVVFVNGVVVVGGGCSCVELLHVLI